MGSSELADMQTAALVNRYLCAHNGRMELGEFYAIMSSMTFRDELETLLGNPDMCAIVVDQDGNKAVVAKTKVRLCKTRDCNGCSNLHLCKFYLYGVNCPHNTGRRVCHFSHDVYSEQNAGILRDHNLQQLDKRELCTLLLQNDSLLPPVCFTYNRGVGEYGHCPDKESCRRLHICERYIRGTCASGMECNRSHDFYEPHPMKTLQDRGVPNEMIQSMLSSYQNIAAMWDANSNNANSKRPINVTEKTEICLFHIKNYCKQGNKCWKVHFHLPYKWVVKDGHVWKALADNEGIEMDYCDPAKTYSEGSEPVHFDTMTRNFMEVRRLSTVSSVVQPTYILTTKWAWFWEDEFGHWTPYASAVSDKDLSVEGAHHSSSITSEDLEKKYQEDSSATVEFTVGKHTYELDMQDMIQANKHYGTKRLVRRRPVFVSAADVGTIKSSQKESSSRSHYSKALPRHWDKSGMPDTGFKRVTLHGHSDEYKEILDLFDQTMSGFRVNTIERVQNRVLWEVFQWQGDLMRKNGAGKENGKFLFHGTDSKHIDAICQQNVDWRICGTHGTAYGKGSYFARDAKYSHRYTSQAGTRSMFVCRVLVGDYTKGDTSYLRPPSKDERETIFYDSCVNSISNPSIFVVFEKHQVYPEYLIQYGEDNQQPAVLLSTNPPKTIPSPFNAFSTLSEVARTTALPTSSPTLVATPVQSVLEGAAPIPRFHPSSSTVASASTLVHLTPSPSGLQPPSRALSTLSMQVTTAPTHTPPTPTPSPSLQSVAGYVTHPLIVPPRPISTFSTQATPTAKPSLPPRPISTLSTQATPTVKPSPPPRPISTLSTQATPTVKPSPPPRPISTFSMQAAPTAKPSPCRYSSSSIQTKPKLDLIPSMATHSSLTPLLAGQVASQATFLSELQAALEGSSARSGSSHSSRSSFASSVSTLWPSPQWPAPAVATTRNRNAPKPASTPVHPSSQIGSATDLSDLIIPVSDLINRFNKV